MWFGVNRTAGPSVTGWDTTVTDLGLRFMGAFARSSQEQLARDFGHAVLAAVFLDFHSLERDAKLQYWTSVQRAWLGRAREQGHFIFELPAYFPSNSSNYC